MLEDISYGGLTGSLTGSIYNIYDPVFEERPTGSLNPPNDVILTDDYIVELIYPKEIITVYSS